MNLITSIQPDHLSLYHWYPGIKNMLGENFGIYGKAQYPEIRQYWQSQMDEIVKTIYSINQPISHKVDIIKIK